MTDCSTVFYAREPTIETAAFRQILIESGLGAVRPVDDLPRLQAMIDAADLIVTARRDGPDGPLVGVVRGVTDFAWCCYLSEVAVSAEAQGLGIGKGLLDAARRELGPSVMLMLASVPDAAGFYRRAGMEPVPDVFVYRRER